MLAPGDEILDYDGNTPLTVISNVLEETTERVYNFEVEGTHTYFAGDVGAWVHNASSAGRLQVDIFRGRAPPEALRAHGSRFPHEKPHVHLNINGKECALNNDGTFKHGSAVIPKRIAKWLRSDGWKVP